MTRRKRQTAEAVEKIDMTKWPATKVEIWPLENIKPYPHNPRNHPQSAIDALAADMLTTGVTTPILVDEAGVILYGHKRRLAALKNQFTHYPVNIAVGWTDEMKRAARIADTKRQTESSWNPELLRIELSELKAAGFDLGKIGFSNEELAALFDKKKTKVDPNYTPPKPPKASVKAGELWLLGRHRILCGDATNADDVARVMGGKKPHLLVTDQPFGVNYDPSWRDGAVDTPANGRGRSTGKVQNDERADWREAWALFPGDVIYCWFASNKAPTVGAALEACGFELRYEIIWNKNNFALGRGDYHWKHEPCWYAVRKGRTSHWIGGRKQSTVWDIEKPQKNETFHGTQKPVECMRRPVENNSKPGDLVYEPFCGSGTTLVACEETGRTCVALEIDPIYVEVTIQRWEAVTGLKATREDGALLAEVRKGKTPKAKKKGA